MAIRAHAPTGALAVLRRRRTALLGSAVSAVLLTGVTAVATRLDDRLPQATASTSASQRIGRVNPTAPAPVAPAPAAPDAAAGGGSAADVESDLRAHLLIPGGDLQPIEDSGDGMGMLTLDDLRRSDAAAEYDVIVRCGGVAGYRQIWENVATPETRPGGLLGQILRFRDAAGARCYTAGIDGLLGRALDSVTLPGAPAGTAAFRGASGEQDFSGLITIVNGGPYAVELVDFRSQGNPPADELGADASDQKRILDSNPPAAPAPAATVPSGGTTA